MKTLDLNEMENVYGGNDFADGILAACLVVGVAASIGGAFITFGTSLFWGTSLTSAFCAGAAVGAALHHSSQN